jgi:hypothetical protein
MENNEHLLSHVRELVLASPEYQAKCQEVTELQSELRRAGWKIEELEKAIQLTDNEKKELAATVAKREKQLAGVTEAVVGTVDGYVEKIGIDREQMVRDYSRLGGADLDMWGKLGTQIAEKKGSIETDQAPYHPTEDQQPPQPVEVNVIDNDCDGSPEDGIDNNCDESFDGDQEVAALVPAEKSEPPRGFWGFIFRWMFKISFWRR